MRFILIGILATGALFAQPALESIGASNAASLIPGGLAGGGVAQGALFALRGTGIGPEEAAVGESFPLAKELGGVTVKVTVGETTVEAWVIRAQARRVVALLPSTTPVGKGKVELSFGGAAATTDIEVVQRAFGIFSRSGSGNGPGHIKNVEDDVDNTLTASAQTGQRVRIRGTGLGPVEGDEGAAAITGEIDAPVEVFIGLKPATVSSKGRTDSPGVDLITAEVPSGVEGCYVSVVVKIGDRVSNYVTMAVAPGKSCTDPVGLSGTDLEAIQPGADFRLGTISLNRSSLAIEIANTLTDTAGGSFFKFAGSQLGGVQGSGLITSFGSCVVIQIAGETPSVPTLLAEGLDAGTTMLVTGPKGTKEIKMEKGAFGGTLGSGTTTNIPLPIPLPSLGNPYLDEGNYTVTNGSGGADVGSFTASITIGRPMEWTNRATTGTGSPVATLSRSSEVPITWSGGGANDVISILGFSFDTILKGGAMFLCTERASAGRFVIPAIVLQSLPVSPAIGGGVLSVSSAPGGGGTRFTASGLDYGSLTYSFTSVKTIRWE